MQTIVLCLRYIVLILLFSSAYYTSFTSLIFIILSSNILTTEDSAPLRSRAIRRLVLFSKYVHILFSYAYAFTFAVCISSTWQILFSLLCFVTLRRKFLEKIFNRLDKSGNGELTLQDLMDGARRETRGHSAALCNILVYNLSDFSQ